MSRSTVLARLALRHRVPLASGAAAGTLLAAGIVRASARCTFEHGGMTLRVRRGLVHVAALDHDVIRVRASATGVLPEDASWSMLPEARTARVPVVPVRRGRVVGFDTASLRVRVDRRCGAVTIRTVDGRVVSSDVPGTGPVFTGDGFTLHKHLYADEHVFGLGDRAGPIDRRGGSFTLWNTDAYGFEAGSDPLYKAIPFLLGLRRGAAHGLLLNNTWRTSFDVGHTQPNELRVSAAGGPLDYVVLNGPGPKDVLRRYAALTGHAPLPPAWAFGYQQSRYSYMSADALRTVAATFRRKRIPADVLWLDIDYQDRNRPFTVNPDSFPDLSGLLAELRGQQFHAVLIADMHVPVQPDGTYAPYDGGRTGGHFLHNGDGSLYVGPVWPGPCVFPDFTRAGARAWWGGLHRAFCDAGAAGFWNDMNEPSVFDTPARTIPLDVESRIDEPGFAPRVATQAEIHNVYGMLNVRATHDGLLALRPDQRPFVMTRAAYAGTQRYAVTWTGDNSSTWAHLRLSTPMLLGLGLSGMPFCGVDLGGFVGTPSPELLTRWLQLGMFNPLSRDHTDKNTPPQEPWVHGRRHEAIRRDAIEARYRLLPYVYTVAEQAAREGIPMMRPMFLEFPEAGGRWTLDHAAPTQFMWGPDLLVAPPPHGEQLSPYPVLLPPGDWYDYWTGLRVTGASGAVLTVEGRARPRTDADGPGSGLRLLPVTPVPELLAVFVRAGAIIPRQPLVQDTGQVPDGPLQLHVYPGPDCRGALYADDGTSFAYRSGGFLRLAYRGETTAGGTVLREADRSGSFRPWWREVEIVLHEADPADAVLHEADPADAVPGWQVDPPGRTATIVATQAQLAEGIRLPRTAATAA